MAALTPPARCLAFGRRIASDVRIPGAIPGGEALAPEIVIRRDTCSAVEAQVERGLWCDGTGLHIACPGVATYRCAMPGTIAIVPRPGAEDEAIAALLIATALPALLWLQGAFMLHASAAVLPGHERAVAIAAASGVGKSAALAQLHRRGARIVADDSVCLRPDSATIGASGLPGGYFAHHPDPAARPFVVVGLQETVVEAPLGLVLLLSRGPADPPSTFRRLAPLAALAGLLAQRHRPAIPALLGDPARRLDDAVRVARTPVWSWRRPTGESRLTDDEWRAIARLSRESSDG